MAEARYETIRCEIADGVATITLDRPDVLNAMNDGMRRELTRCFAELAGDDDDPRGRGDRRGRARVLRGGGHPGVRGAPGAGALPRAAAPPGLPSGHGPLSAADHRGHSRVRARRRPRAGPGLRHPHRQRGRPARPHRGQPGHHPRRRRHAAPAPARGARQGAGDDPHRRAPARGRGAAHRPRRARGAAGRGASRRDAARRGRSPTRRRWRCATPRRPWSRDWSCRWPTAFAWRATCPPCCAPRRIGWRARGPSSRSGGRGGRGNDRRMPFAYYARLNRSQQAIYRRSDGIAEVPLRQPETLHPLVAALAARAHRRGSRGHPGRHGAPHPWAHRRPRHLARARRGARRPPARPVGRAARPLHGRARPDPAHPALDAHGQAEARGGLSDLPAHPAPRGRPPHRLHAAAASGLVPHGGLLQAGVEPLLSARPPPGRRADRPKTGPLPGGDAGGRPGRRGGDRLLHSSSPG